VVFTIIGFGSVGLNYLCYIVENYNNDDKLHINIISPYDFFITGTKYATFNTEYILTKTAQEIDPNYYHWLCKFYPQYEFETTSFTPRYIYGQYLLYKFEKIKNLMKKKNITHTIIHDLVDDIVDIINPNTQASTLISLTLTNSIVRTDKIIISIGKDIESITEISSIKHGLVYCGIFDIWSKQAFTLHQNANAVCYYYNQNYLKSPTKIVIIGSGTQAIELIYNLLKTNFSGKIYCISRTGEFNKAHQEYNIINKLLTINDARNGLIFMINKIRKFLKNNSEYDINDVIASVDIAELWDIICDKDKKRFISHLYHKYNIFANRILPQISDALNEGLKDNKISLLKGTVYDITRIENNNVVYYSNNSHRGAISSHVIVNTGEVNNYFKNNSFMKHLLKHNLVSYSGLEYKSCDDRIIIANNILN
jgi:uncharacterized NAD(P)/FAD-binding protein YdhS